MGTAIYNFFEFISNFDCGTLYPVIISACVATILFFILATGCFVYGVRKADKTSLLALSLVVYTVSAVKIVCDFLSKPVKEEFVFSCLGGMFLAAASFGEYALLVLQSNIHPMLNKREKRLIAQLSRFDEHDGEQNGLHEILLNHNLLEDDFLNLKDYKTSSHNGLNYNSAFKQVEFLPVFKGDNKEEGKEYGLNFNEVFAQIDNARNLNLSQSEAAILDNLELDVENFSRRNLTCEERRRLSRGLLNLIKILSKP